jgi:LCP family protein required for cell wall assembly
MTLVAPGSAQLAAGNKRVGRIVLRLWAAALAGTGLLAAVALRSRTRLLELGTSLWFLGLARVVLVVAAVGFGCLIIDAWRISEPMRLTRGQRLFMAGLNGITCFALSGALLLASHYLAVQRSFIQHVFAGQHAVAAQDGRFNILLLGGDAGADRWGLRPDSITVASIDEQTGRTVLFGLPRNLQNVPFPAGTAMDRRFPHGFSCSGCYLNGVYTWASGHRRLFPGVEDPGVYATTEAVEATTGLAISYYVLIDMRGFRDLVDAVGGVTVYVPERLPIGGVGGPVTGHIQPGRRHLNGYQALWFARSRATSDDYSRMARQKCLMNAMLHQLSPQQVLTHFSRIATAGRQVLATSIPPSEVGRFVTLAAKARSHPIRSVSFVPPRINGYDPDFTLIRQLVTSAVRRAEDADAGRRAHHPNVPDQYAANDSGNLSRTC